MKQSSYSLTVQIKKMIMLVLINNNLMSVRFNPNSTPISSVMPLQQFRDNRYNCIFRLLKAVYDNIAQVLSYCLCATVFTIVCIVVVKRGRLPRTIIKITSLLTYRNEFISVCGCVCMSVLTCYRGRTVDRNRHRTACLSPQAPGGHHNSRRRPACTTPATAPACRATQTQR